MLAFLKEKWPELLIVGILLPIVAVGWSLRGEISKMDGTLVGVVQRVDHIAEAMPDLKIRIANEMTRRPAKTIILTGTTYQIGETSVSPVNIVDLKTGQRRVFTVRMSNQQDKMALWGLAGVIQSVDRSSSSFGEMESYSQLTNDVAFVPDDVQKNWSYVSFMDASVLINALNEAGYKDLKISKNKVVTNKGVDWTWDRTVGSIRAGELAPERPQGSNF